MKATAQGALVSADILQCHLATMRSDVAAQVSYSIVTDYYLTMNYNNVFLASSNFSG